MTYLPAKSAHLVVRVAELCIGLGASICLRIIAEYGGPRRSLCGLPHNGRLAVLDIEHAGLQQRKLIAGRYFVSGTVALYCS
jgi:hypothetical protein